MTYLQGKRGLVVGIANQRSIAYGIARACADAGAELALTVQSERLRGKVEALAADLNCKHLSICDLTNDDDIENLRAALDGAFGGLDFIVHAVAFAEREDLEGRFLDTGRSGFAMAMDVSVYTLISLVRGLEPLLTEGSSILTLSYLGSERAVPNYNVMGVAKAALEASVRYLASELGPKGIRVNALSPGPIRTLSAAGISGLRTMLNHVETTAPLRRNVTAEDVGGAALMPLSDLGRGITGEVIHVDGGYNITSGPAMES